MGSRKNRTDRKKAKFHGNQYVNDVERKPLHEDASRERKIEVRKRPRSIDIDTPVRQDVAITSNIEAPRSSKCLVIDNEAIVEDDKERDYFILVNFGSLANLLGDIGRCPECHNLLLLQNIHEARMGFANKLMVVCKRCKWESSLYTSSITTKPATGNSGGRGRNYFEANIRASIAFREIGKGHQGMENFTRIMNMKGLSCNAYNKMKEDICNAYSKVASDSMSGAASEVAQTSKDKLASDPSITICG